MKLQAIYPASDAQTIYSAHTLFTETCHSRGVIPSIQMLRTPNYVELVGDARQLLYFLVCLFDSGIDSLIEVQQVPA